MVWNWSKKASFGGLEMVRRYVLGGILGFLEAITFGRSHRKGTVDSTMCLIFLMIMVWMVQHLNDHFWPLDVHEILKIRTSPRQRQDFFPWHPEKNMHFFVKSAYYLVTAVHDEQFAGGASSTSLDGNRSIWNLFGIRVFLYA